MMDDVPTAILKSNIPFELLLDGEQISKVFFRNFSARINVVHLSYFFVVHCKNVFPQGHFFGDPRIPPPRKNFGKFFEFVRDIIIPVEIKSTIFFV
jgi:hypothetical protein